MTKKKYIGQLISINFKDRPTPISGFVIDYNDEWTLLRQNPVDYIIDGYIIVRHKNIEGVSRKKEELFKERILKLKNLQPTWQNKMPLTDLNTILSYLTKKFGVFQFEQKSEKSCWLGSLISFDKKDFIIKPLLSNGKWDKDTLFFIKDLRTIEFDTDYINSLKLVEKDNKKLLKEKGSR
jgi:hypothetical protein